MKPPIIFLAASLCAAPAFAQDVPAPVIEQCQSSSNANELPECLGEGAVGYILLQRAASETYFGESIRPVLQICEDQNDTFAAAWTCVAEAAATAVETARLIPRDTIMDTCVRALADPEVLAQLTADRQTLRTHFRPSETFFGGNMYMPFRGCREALSETEPPQEDGQDAFDASECAAVNAFDTFLRERSAEDLRALVPILDPLEDEDRLAALIDFGLDAPSIDTLTARATRSESDAMALGLLGLALLERVHPELSTELFDLGEPNDGMTDEIASGLISTLTNAALERFEASCAV